MSRSTKPSMGIWIIAAAASALLVLTMAAVLTLTPHSSASADPDVLALRQAVEGYEMATRTAADIPAASLPLIKEKVAALGGKATADDHILTEADKAAMNSKYALAVKTYCTPDMAGSMGTDIGSVVDDTLLAEAAYPAGLVVEVQRKVMAVEVQKKSGSEAYAWAYFWAGDVYAKGYGPQNWEVLEYRLVSDGETWRIDNCRSLGILYPSSDSAEFGPYSPHGTVDDLEMTQGSQLAPGQAIPLDLLKRLEAAAVDQKQL